MDQRLQSKDVGWLTVYKKQEPLICYLKDTSELITQIESEGMEKDISCKWKQQESRGSNTHIRQHRL